MWQSDIVTADGAEDETPRRLTWEVVLVLAVSVGQSALYSVLSHDQDHTATDESMELHIETLETVMRGDHAAIDEVMDRHLRYLESRCEEMFGRARLPQVPRFLTGGSA